MCSLPNPKLQPCILPALAGLLSFDAEGDGSIAEGVVVGVVEDCARESIAKGGDDRCAVDCVDIVAGIDVDAKVYLFSWRDRCMVFGDDRCRGASKQQRVSWSILAIQPKCAWKTGDGNLRSREIDQMRSTEQR